MTFKQGMAYAQRVAVEQAEAKCPRRAEHDEPGEGKRAVRCEGCGLWVRWVRRDEP